MTTNVAPTITQLSQNAKRVSWEALDYVDPTPGPEDYYQGSAIAVGDYADVSVQVMGTFGTATVLLEGSNDGGTTYTTLNDPQGNALTFTTAKIEQVLEPMSLIRPRVSVGDESMDVDVVLFMRRQRGGRDT